MSGFRVTPFLTGRVGEGVIDGPKKTPTGNSKYVLTDVTLASDESSYSTGSTFVVDGGLAAAYVTPEFGNAIGTFLGSGWPGGWVEEAARRRIEEHPARGGDSQRRIWQLHGHVGPTA